MWHDAFWKALFQSWCQLGVALCSIRFGGQRSGQNLREEVEWREAMELPASHTSSLFGRMRLLAGAKKHARPSRSPRKMWNVSHSFRVLHPSVKRVIINIVIPRRTQMDVCRDFLYCQHWDFPTANYMAKIFEIPRVKSKALGIDQISSLSLIQWRCTASALCQE